MSVGAVASEAAGARRPVPPRTERRDTWWVEPLIVVLVLGGFIVYATWAALQNAHYYAAPYLSPFYSPCLATNCEHRTLPFAIPWIITPAMLILWIPGGFRLTCYYYRGAYYKAFWADPPACAVGEPRKTYWGERTFPLVLQNLHRNFLRLSYIVWAFLLLDAVKAFFFPDGFGIGVGTVVLVI